MSAILTFSFPISVCVFCFFVFSLSFFSLFFFLSGGGDGMVYMCENIGLGVVKVCVNTQLSVRKKREKNKSLYNIKSSE